MGHARAILGVLSATAQALLARKVVADRLTVRQTEELVRAAPDRKSKPKKPGRRAAYAPAEARLVENLQRRLGTKVDLRRRSRGGLVVIHYFAPEELDRIVSVIEGR
jgi:ParB family chromosome partitioning protein